MGMRTESEEEWRDMDPLCCELGSIGMVSQLGRREETGSPRLSLRESADTVLPSTFRVVMAPPSPPHHSCSEELPIVTFEERFTPEPDLETLTDGALTSLERWNRGCIAGCNARCIAPDIHTGTNRNAGCNAGCIAGCIAPDIHTGTNRNAGCNAGCIAGCNARCIAPDMHTGTNRNAGCNAGCIAGCNLG
ncbi:hypothetical protein GE061_014102 [Apolygus lucorum]|uniref:Uncharacterized protein n=1 Tax=Apolygus lucorum TaxID=248454 RepID=A0A8S9XQX3_APOLU|nr:hypothetical protein GE061_014102 [Apolygus lucorum]